VLRPMRRALVNFGAMCPALLCDRRNSDEKRVAALLVERLGDEEPALPALNLNRELDSARIIVAAMQVRLPALRDAIQLFANVVVNRWVDLEFHLSILFFRGWRKLAPVETAA